MGEKKCTDSERPVQFSMNFHSGLLCPMTNKVQLQKQLSGGCKSFTDEKQSYLAVKLSWATNSSIVKPA